MHHTHLEAIAVIQKLAFSLTPADYERVDVSVHPAFTALRSVQTVLDAEEIPIRLGAQNVYWEDHGAFTGEVSPSMLAKLHVRYVIAGHSERRQLFGETDEMVGRKVRAILGAGMVPIVCVGETLQERNAGECDQKVCAQVKAALDGVSGDAAGDLVIAYEPLWAIGSGRNATPDDAQAVCAEIRAAVANSHGAQAAAALRLQYGGSVKPTNVAELIKCEDIDGALVGGASLDAEQFAQIITAGRP